MQLPTTNKPTCGSCKHLYEQHKCDISGKRQSFMMAACPFHPAIITDKNATLLEQEYKRKQAEREAKEAEKQELKAKAKKARRWG